MEELRLLLRRDRGAGRTTTLSPPPPCAPLPRSPCFLLLLFLLLLLLEAASATATGHPGGGGGGGGGGGSSNNHHRKGHHNVDSRVNTHHEPRAARTRREQEESTETTGSGDDILGSEAPTEIRISCTGTTADECASIVNSECSRNNICDCPVSHPILDIDHSHCVKEAKLNNKCNFSSECEAADEFSYCSPASLCVCKDNYYTEELPDVGSKCITESDGPGAVDPAMIGVLAGLALMFVIICVVLRLFSKARFRENRSIFNTPNPRLMNASLFKDSKLLSPARGDRRGSRASVRVPSRAASVTSVSNAAAAAGAAAAASRSPNGSLAKGGRRGSALSAASATGSVAAGSGGRATSKSPSPSKETKTKPETTVAIETVD